MQSYIQPRFTEQEGHALWKEILDDVKDCNLTTPPFTRTLLNLFIFSILFSLTIYFSWSLSSVFLLSLSYICIALLLAQFAFIGHNAGHGSVSHNKMINRIIGQFCMTLVTGLAFDEWIGRHRTHHRYCQHEDRDPDIEVNFVVSLTEKSKQQKGAIGRFITRYQAIHIWLMSFLFGHSQRHLSQIAALSHPRQYLFDTVMTVFHFTLWFGVPCLLLDVPFWVALLSYIIPLTILGPYLAAIFWVNHMGMPLVDKVEDFSFLEHQYATSRTIINPPGWNWVFGGLNFQIEHHLFPQVPSYHLMAVQKIVKKHFDRHAIEYHGVSWWDAVRAIKAHLHNIAIA
jgi:fatty acid desaturase